MTQPLETSSRLSGVDPFRAPEFPVGEEHIETAWFDAPASTRGAPSSRRMSTAPSAPPAPPIGDRDADAWFR
jgi:hypothetical protein